MIETPTLKQVLSLKVNIGEPLPLGQTAAGFQINYPITGGTFSGEGFNGERFNGEVLASGADFFCQHDDGTATLDARYSLRTEDGVIINITNTGILTLTEQGLALDRAGIWPVPESEYRCECMPRFQAPAGRYSCLTERALIGRVTYPKKDEVHVTCYALA